MGYTIAIGEAEIEYFTDEAAEDCHLRIGCEIVEHESAPDLGHGDISGKGNQRHPSYTQWHNFCREAGIYDVFYKVDDFRTMMRGETIYEFRGGHPGAFILHKDHLLAIKDAKARLLAKKPGAKCPSEIPCTKEAASAFDETGCCVEGDWVLGRLNWLEFWMDWALTNCKQPVVVNS